MNQVATQPKNSSAPASAADEPPPHPGFDAPAAHALNAGTISHVSSIRRAQPIDAGRAGARDRRGSGRECSSRRNAGRATWTARVVEMRRVCAMPMMADRAFSSLPERRRRSVRMGSIHLARELARIWGNIGYGSKELARNDVKGESEMTAVCLGPADEYVRPETTFIGPAYSSTLQGGRKKKLTATRDRSTKTIANMGARRMSASADLRRAAAVVHRRGRGPLPADLGARRRRAFEKRLADMLAAFKVLGVTREMIEKRTGSGAVNLTSAQLADLKIVYRSLKNNEISRDEAFPRPRPPTSTRR
jgi:hypothetical protein